MVYGDATIGYSAVKKSVSWIKGEKNIQVWATFWTNKEVEGYR